MRTLAYILLAPLFALAALPLLCIGVAMCAVTSVVVRVKYRIDDDDSCEMCGGTGLTLGMPPCPCKRGE